MARIGLILMESKCSLNCVFCNGREMGDIEKNIEFELNKLREFTKREKDIEVVEISGNDPCEYDGLPEFVSRVREIAHPREIMVSTHGGMMSDRSYLKRLVEAGMNAVRIPVYGAKQEVHEAVTCAKGSFDNLTKVLKNIKKLKKKENRKMRVVLTSLIVKDNQDHLKELFYLFKFLSDFADEFYLSIPGFVHNQRRFFSHVPDFERLRKQLPDALRYALSLGLAVNVHDIPMCLIRFDYPYYFNTTVKGTRAYEYRKNDPLMEEIDGELFPKYLIKTKSEECRQCRYDSICEGIYREYYRQGFFKFTPILKKNKN